MDLEEYGHFPLREFLGMGIEDVGPGHAIARLEVGNDLLNPNGVVHGGVYFTMADTAMGQATMTSLDEGQFSASVEIQMRFLRPVSSGRLEAEPPLSSLAGRSSTSNRGSMTPMEPPWRPPVGTFAVVSARPTARLFWLWRRSDVDAMGYRHFNVLLVFHVAFERRDEK